MGQWFLVKPRGINLHVDARGQSRVKNYDCSSTPPLLRYIVHCASAQEGFLFPLLFHRKTQGATQRKRKTMKGARDTGLRENSLLASPRVNDPNLPNMCSYWATTFPCGCFTFRASGYEFCEQRGSKECKVTLRRYRWRTFCPSSRRALRGRKYTPGIRLPACCGKIGAHGRARLCCKCDSSPTDPSEGPTLWHCPAHLQLVSEDKDVSVEEAQAFFGKAVVLWPVDHQKRYLRRKNDSAAKGVWWSY